MINNKYIFVGICLEILAAALGTMSKQLIAVSEHLHRPLLFHIGAGMNMFVGPVVDASAYAFAPQVIVAPFACLDVIFNALTAPYVLHWQHEKLTKAHVIGCGLVATGAVLTAIFAGASNETLDVDELEQQLRRPESLTYLAAELILILAATFALKRGLLSPMVRGVALGVIAGVLMGNVFFVKGFIGLVKTSINTGDGKAWLRPTPYAILAAAAGGAILGHVFMRKGLGEYKGVFMVTIFQGAHIAAACLSGSVVMAEMAETPLWKYCMYWGAFCILVAGMLIINTAAPEAELKKGFHLAQSFQDQDEAKAPIGRTWEDSPSFVIEDGFELDDVNEAGGHDEENQKHNIEKPRAKRDDEVSSSESTGTPEPDPTPRAAHGREETVVSPTRAIPAPRSVPPLSVSD